MTDLNKEREAFEAIKEIHDSIRREQLIFNTKLGCYTKKSGKMCVSANWTNGAWFMFQEKAKAQAVPEDCAIVPKELHIEIALKMAKERILQQPLGKDPVWNELVEQVYKDNLQAEQCRLIRDYREMVKASESGAEG